MTDFMSELGNNIRSARKSAGMTQRELAVSIGVTPPAVSFYENGQRMPNLMTMRMMSTALGVAIDDMVPDHVIYHVMPCAGQMDIYEVIEDAQA